MLSGLEHAFKTDPSRADTTIRLRAYRIAVGAHTSDLARDGPGRQLARLRDRQTGRGTRLYRRLYRRSGRHLCLPIAHCGLAG